jgi:hypothetical protein
MVRILEVEDLGEKKKELLARSEIYRQTLALEAANVRLSVNLLKKRMRVVKTVYRLLGWAVPVSGLVFGHKEKEGKAGLLGRFLAGFDLASKIKDLFGAGGKTEPEEEQATEPKRV